MAEIKKRTCGIHGTKYEVTVKKLKYLKTPLTVGSCPDCDKEEREKNRARPTIEMNKEEAEEFANQIEDSYKDYSSGMRNAIISYICRLKKDEIKKLYQYTIQEHDRVNPPNLNTIIRYMHDLGIRKIEAVEYYSLCEHCGEKFDLNAFKCPDCNKMRKSGQVVVIK